MAVWCPDWPAVAAARAEGHGLHLPLAVIGPRGVLACNAVARAVGVRRGLRRREAQFRCPELVVVAADPARDAAWFEPVVQALDAVVPGIEVLRPGLFVFSAAGALRFHGGVEQVVTRVVDAVAAAGVECQVGLADELPTAVLGARGSALLEPGGDTDYLAGLPVEALVVEPALGDPEVLSELVGLLHRLGVRTLGDFAALPPRDVATRFGEAGSVAHRIARAVPWRPPSVTAVPTGSAVEHRCDPPLERVDEAAFLGRRLAGELHAVLAAAGVSCLRLSITARVEGGTEVNRVWRCSSPLTPEGTADRLRWQLEGWLTGTAITGGTGGAVTALVLEPVEVVPAGRVQEGLWGEAGLAEARSTARSCASRDCSDPRPSECRWRWVAAVRPTGCAACRTGTPRPSPPPAARGRVHCPRPRRRWCGPDRATGSRSARTATRGPPWWRGSRSPGESCCAARRGRPSG
ncbi:hypothetical protein ES5_10846 [Dietzia cinnamea P4]|nr:hypothetical protein ES5_10846 [Dietzia cinnamea P4]